MDIETLKAGETDKDFFKQLNETCYRQIVVELFGSWDSAAESKKFDLKWAENRFLKIIVNDRVAGGVWVDEHDSYHQLREIQLLPEYRNQGIGGQVVRDCIERARSRKKPLRLKVLKTNPAVGLYQRLGFKVYDYNEASQQYLMEMGE